MKTIYVKRDGRGLICNALEAEMGQNIDPVVKSVVEMKTAVEKGLKEGQEKVDCIFKKVKNDHRLKGWLGRLNTAISAVDEGADGADLDLLIKLKNTIEEVQKEYNARHNIIG